MYGKEIEFDSPQRVLPKEGDGYLILVRDRILYHRSPKAFFPLFETNCVGINPEDILPTDIIYNFPKKETIFNHLQNNRCLDAFLIDKDSLQTYKKKKVEEMLRNGKIIAAKIDDKYHLYLESGSIRWKNFSSLIGHSFSNFGDKTTIYSFDNIYQLGAWLAQS